MVFCRYEWRGTAFAGVLKDACVHRLRGTDSLIPVLSGGVETVAEHALPLDSVRLLPPVPDAPNIFCAGSNYLDHVREAGGKELEKSRVNPWFFMKPRGSMVGPDDEIPIPVASPAAIDWECELALVIATRAKHVAASDAMRHVAGFSIFIDYSDRNFSLVADREQRPWDPFFDWLHGKWHDRFSAMGPFLVTPEELPAGLSDLQLQLSVNGEPRQNSSTRNMIFSPAELVAFLSRIVTLQPGDIISTGTPGGVAATLHCPYLQPGDLVEAEIPRLGTLRNRMVSEALT